MGENGSVNSRGSLSLARLLAAMAGLALLVSACSGRGDASPSPGPSASATAVPGSPTRAPTPATTPARPTATMAAPSATATATVRPIPGGQVFEHGPRDTSMVALTFDMGGRVDPALDIMNWLIENRVKATIFMTGAMADNPNTDAGREVLRLVELHPGLFTLGNHSYSHPDFRELTQTAMALELLRTENAIDRLVPGLSPKPFFRPPYGGVDPKVVAGVAAAGYDRIVMWDVDTIDWRPPAEGGPSAGEIVAKVTGNARGGSIVLMHLGGYNTLEALPDVVAGLRSQGLEPVTLAELLR